MFKEFRDFAMRGNVVDLAIGVIIGAAFGSIVTSLVNDIIMPPVGWLTGGIDFSKLVFTLPPGLAAAPDAPAVTINYGKFLNACISFGIISWVLFMLVKGMNRLKRKEAAAPTGPTPTESLLMEIRDLLKARSG